IPDDFGMRLDFDIPPQEREFLQKRKVLVGQALQKLLGLSSPLEPKKVPVIAVVGSGGGTRAMTGLFGGLKGLQQVGALDAVTYITGVSGSTWAMSTLYQDANWSKQDINSVISVIEGRITKSFMSSLSKEKRRYYDHEMEERTKEGHLMSYVHKWGLIIEHLLFEKVKNGLPSKTTTTLSDQGRAVSDGQNPFPIYTAVNMMDKISGCEPEAEWCEFTPYEIGIEKYGAFVRTEDFGSHFFLGHMIKKLPEVSIPYLIGIWSSAFSVSLNQLWQVATGSTPAPEEVTVDSQQANEAEPSTMDTYLVNQCTDATGFERFLKNRPVVAQVYNFMRGLLLHWDYNEYCNFKAWNNTHPDAYPNRLTPNDPILNLVDAGHAINIGCVPILRPQREVDLIISLSYSWEPANILKKTANYCKDHDIPFPNVDYAIMDAAHEKEVYVFEDGEDPNAPIVLHFPMVNDTYRQFKAPGVPRKGEKEMKAGEVDVKTNKSPYKTKNLTYSKEDFRALVDLTSYNVINNKQHILNILRRAVEKKAAKMTQ
uniref:PLA2c domain-containing protein n=1 Tax=Myripristis murdjan TaxID=586833 RepID=A0A668AID6_9TELE